MKVSCSFAAGVLSLAVGCSPSTPSFACHAGVECESGICGSDSQCVPVGTDAGSAPVDAAPEASVDAAGKETGAPTGCTPNGDGVVTAAEVPLGPGLHATFRVASNTPIDTAGKPGSGTARSWDWSGALSGDQNTQITTAATAGAWYAGSFPQATYASRLSPSADLLGVFRVAPQQIELLGVVSPTNAPPQTNLSYGPAAVVLQFPLSVGATWKSTSTITGTASGLAAAYTEVYDSKVDARGTMKTPFGSFEVLRVATVLTRTIGVVPTVTRSFSYVAECFGTVASATSLPNEVVAEFTTASSAQRIAP